jgi:uncharacterized protein
MTASTANPVLLDRAIAALLACPVCHGDLRPVETWLTCAGCGRGYPVVDGIPVLIAERAEGSA